MLKRIKLPFCFSTMADPYYILGIEKGIPFSEVKKAYYKMAALYHPDINKSPVYNISNFISLLFYKI